MQVRILLWVRMKKLAEYVKSLIVAVAALIFTVSSAVTDKQITEEEWVAVAGAWGTVVAVYAARNRVSDDQLVRALRERSLTTEDVRNP